MRLRHLLTITASVAVLGGCAMRAARVATPAPVIELHACRNLGGNFAVPFARAAAALPAGFEPMPTRGGRRAGAVFYVIAVHCRQGIVDGRRLGPSWLVYAELPVAPDPAAAIPGITDYTVPLAFTARPAALARAFAAHGLGDGSVARITGSLPHKHSGAQLRVEAGVLGFSLLGRTWNALQPGPGAGRFALFGVRDGRVTHTLIGSTTAAGMRQGPLHLEVRGGPALLDAASPQARGFSLDGFDLTFRPPRQP